MASEKALIVERQNEVRTAEAAYTATKAELLKIGEEAPNIERQLAASLRLRANEWLQAAATLASQATTVVMPHEWWRDIAIGFAKQLLEFAEHARDVEARAHRLNLELPPLTGYELLALQQIVLDRAQPSFAAVAQAVTGAGLPCLSDQGTAEAHAKALPLLSVTRVAHPTRPPMPSYGTRRPADELSRDARTIESDADIRSTPSLAIRPPSGTNLDPAGDRASDIRAAITPRATVAPPPIVPSPERDTPAITKGAASASALILALGIAGWFMATDAGARGCRSPADEYADCIISQSKSVTTEDKQAQVKATLDGGSDPSALTLKRRFEEHVEHFGDPCLLLDVSAKCYAIVSNTPVQSLPCVQSVLDRRGDQDDHGVNDLRPPADATASSQATATSQPPPTSNPPLGAASTTQARSRPVCNYATLAVKACKGSPSCTAQVTCSSGICYATGPAGTTPSERFDPGCGGTAVTVRSGRAVPPGAQ